MPAPPTTVDGLLDLFEEAERLESDEVEEAVGFTDHGLQCAMALRRTAPRDLELQVAGLVHDLGHLTSVGDPDAHGRCGADLVRPVLGERVARLVELHVPAKRYLVTADPAYRRHLSATSIRTLAAQGGALTDEQLSAFAADPLASEAVSLRRADDAAKRSDWVVPGLDWWEPLVRSLATGS